jgi:hypothetical protein
LRYLRREDTFGGSLLRNVVAHLLRLLLTILRRRFQKEDVSSRLRRVLLLLGDGMVAAVLKVSGERENQAIIAKNH